MKFIQLLAANPDFTSVTTSPAYNPKPALRSVLELAYENGVIESDGPWVPSRQTLPTELLPNQVLWGDLIIQAAAAQFLEVQPDGFYPGISLEAFDALTPTEVRLRLIQGLTLNLAPPTAAAGVFVGLGIHPMWGLRLVQNCTPFCQKMHLAPPDLPVLETLNFLSMRVFGTLNILFGILRRLDPAIMYPEKHFVAVIHYCLTRTRTLLPAPHQTSDMHPVIITDDDSDLSMDLVKLLAGDILPPLAAAGVLDWTDGGYQTHPETLEGLKIGDYTTIEAQNAFFEFFVAPNRPTDD